MKKRNVKKLTLRRETLANLERLDGTQLGRVAGASRPQQCTASTCLNPYCTCPV
jgi:hypothetical protein